MCGKTRAPNAWNRNRTSVRPFCYHFNSYILCLQGALLHVWNRFTL